MLRRLLAWKYLVGVVLILGSAVYVSRQYQETRQQCEQKSCQVNNIAMAPLGHRQDCDECEQDAERHFPSWYRVFSWPDGIGAWAILLTLLAIAEQTSQTARAVEAARDSIRLQEAGLRQWIELSNWRGHLVEDNREETILLVEVDILNKTNSPLTLKKAEIDFTNTGDKSTRTYYAGEDVFLTPTQPYKVTVAISVSGIQILQFPLGGIGIKIVGRFLHIGVLPNAVSQELTGLLICQALGTHFEPEIHMNPKPESNKPGSDG
jgi:hypothetical protein